MPGRAAEPAARRSDAGVRRGGSRLRPRGRRSATRHRRPDRSASGRWRWPRPCDRSTRAWGGRRAAACAPRRAASRHGEPRGHRAAPARCRPARQGGWRVRRAGSAARHGRCAWPSLARSTSRRRSPAAAGRGPAGRPVDSAAAGRRRGSRRSPAAAAAAAATTASSSASARRARARPAAGSPGSARAWAAAGSAAAGNRSPGGPTAGPACRERQRQTRRDSACHQAMFSRPMSAMAR